MDIEVRRITDPDLFSECAKMTTGKHCTMTWRKALASEHSIIRATQYIVKMHGIPQFVAGHLVRHIHAQPFMRSKRTDRGGADFVSECRRLDQILNEQVAALDEGNSTSRDALTDIQYDILQLPDKFDRYAPTDLALILNAQEFINISKVRTCSCASIETREVWANVLHQLRNVDPDLYAFCVPTCVYRGGICPEPKSCGFNKSDLFQKQLEQYRTLFQ